MTAIPSTADSASKEGRTDHGESMKITSGKMMMLEQISIPAELTTAGISLNRLPNIAAKL
jgi:hypothetical protein